ncbi:MAG: hypothetical protein BYD32DRAFT_449376 [Podila humilis]|nr:MAG: hypothetical protein BYD32DRAFT_449376 [Podila humilis]
MPFNDTYPTPERIWKKHLSFKDSSLLYLPRIEKYLRNFSIPCRIHEAACKLQFFSQYDAFQIIAQGVNSLLFVRHHSTASATDASKLALDCLYALGIPSHTYLVPVLYPALHPALPAPTLLCPDSQSQYMWTPAHYQPEFTNVWFSRAFEAYHSQPRFSHDVLLRSTDALGALLCYDLKIKTPSPPLSKKKPSQGPHFLRQKYEGSCLSVALCNFVINYEPNGVLGTYLQKKYIIDFENKCHFVDEDPYVLSLHNFSFLSSPSSENTGGGEGSPNHILLLLPYKNALWELDGQAEDGLRYIGPCGKKHWTSLAKKRADQWNEQCKAINSNDFIDIHVIVSSLSSSSSSTPERELGLDRRETVIELSTRGTVHSDNWYLGLPEQAMARSYHPLDYG